MKVLFLVIISLSLTYTFNSASYVKCPDGQSSCKTGQRCCLTSSDSYRCCPSSLSCCGDGWQCCNDEYAYKSLLFLSEAANYSFHNHTEPSSLPIDKYAINVYNFFNGFFNGTTIYTEVPMIPNCRDQVGKVISSTAQLIELFKKIKEVKENPTEYLYELTGELSDVFLNLHELEICGEAGKQFEDFYKNIFLKYVGQDDYIKKVAINVGHKIEFFIDEAEKLQKTCKEWENNSFECGRILGNMLSEALRLSN